MVLRRLSGADILGVPAVVIDELRQLARRASTRALRHGAATLDITRRFEQQGIAVLALKGAALSQRLYGDPGMRDVRDVDVLVHPSALASADRLLLKHGYERHFPRIDPTPRVLAALLDHEQHFEYREHAKRIELEVHWRLASWSPQHVEWLWQHSSFHNWPGGAVLREPDAHALLLLVVDHGAHHKWFCLKWLADAAAMFARFPGCQIPALLESARFLDQVRPLAQAVLLVDELYGVSFEPPWRELVRSEPGARPLAEQAIEAMLGSEERHFNSHGWACFRDQRYARNLRSRPPFGFHVLRTRDFDEVALPDRLFPLYYVLRPLLWCRRAILKPKFSESFFESAYLSGAALYGDDFDEPALRAWWKREQRAYFEMAQANGNFTYGHHALNHFHLYRFLTGRYHTCLAFGCARGDEVAPLAARVDRFIAIEPAEEWWSDRINGAEALYRKPALNGDISIDSQSVDLVVCFSVLHHIPNAGHVLSELARVLRPGGLLLLREPICTMGDWRRRRRGLTRDERGFPPAWLDARAAEYGLETIRKVYCGFPLTTRLARLLGLGPAYNNAVLVRLDAWMSRMMSWNLHYHRDSFFKKIAPIEVVYMFTKPQQAAQVLDNRAAPLPVGSQIQSAALARE